MRTVSLVFSSLVLAALTIIPVAGCSEHPISPVTSYGKSAMDAQVAEALAEFKGSSPAVAQQIAHAYGYAVLPSVGAGALVFGAAEGRGELFRQGQLVGYVRMTQGTFGAQIGGQSFRELILFQNAAALQDFKIGAVSFDARATAVAIKAGSGTASNYEHGLVVYAKPTAGLMAQAAIGGQQFTVAPLDQ